MRMIVTWHRGGRRVGFFDGTCAESLAHRMVNKPRIVDTTMRFRFGQYVMVTPDAQLVREANDLLGELLTVELDEGAIVFSGPAIANAPLMHAAVVFCRDGLPYQRAILGLLPGVMEAIGYDHEHKYQFEEVLWGSQNFLSYCVHPSIWAQELRDRLHDPNDYIPIQPCVSTFMLAQFGYTEEIEKTYRHYLKAKSVKYQTYDTAPRSIRSGFYAAFGVPGYKDSPKKVHAFMIDYKNPWFAGAVFLPPADLDVYGWQFDVK